MLFNSPLFFNYKIRHIKYQLKNFPYKNYKILQLSDLHLGYGLQPEIFQHLLLTIRKIHPDLIVITGDFIEGDINVLLPQMKLFGSITSQYPVYMVIGNHDFEYNSPNDVLKAFKSLGIHVLMNEAVWIGKSFKGFNLAGISDPITKIAKLPKYYHPSIERTLQNVREGVTILLSHRPILRYAEKRYGIDLILSGHIHGGQIYPFGLLSIKYKEDSGEKISLYDVNFGDDCYLHVSKGLGYTTLPFRFLARSEISLITLNS